MPHKTRYTVDKEYILLRIAKEMDLPLSVVKNAVESQFRVVNKMIGTNTDEVARLDYFGKFRMNEKLKKVLNGSKDNNIGKTNDTTPVEQGVGIEKPNDISQGRWWEKAGISTKGGV